MVFYNTCNIHQAIENIHKPAATTNLFFQSEKWRLDLWMHDIEYLITFLEMDIWVSSIWFISTSYCSSLFCVFVCVPHAWSCPFSICLVLIAALLSFPSVHIYFINNLTLYDDISAHLIALFVIALVFIEINPFDLDTVAFSISLSTSQ